MTILENNCVQSIATAAGYMTMPLTSGLAAYMWATNNVLPMWQIICFTIVLSILGVLVAFPMKRRFINDEQHPFPEGRACGVVLDALYERAEAASGMFKARALTLAAALAGGVSFISGESYMKLVQEKWLGLQSSWHLPHNLDAWYYSLVDKGLAPLPKLAGVDMRQLALSPTLDFAMIGAGGLMGIRTAVSLLLGAVLNFVIVVPVMISLGEIQPRAGLDRRGHGAVRPRAHPQHLGAVVGHHHDGGRRAWWRCSRGPRCSSRPSAASRGAAAGARPAATCCRTSSCRCPSPGSACRSSAPFGVWMAHDWFGVHWLLGALSIPLILVLALIAASSTALTGITPSSSLSKIPQFTFGALDPRTPAPNLMTAVMSAEVASNASNLLMDIKPGYMLGAKPRQQAIGHVIGIVAGALAATPLFFLLFGLTNFDPAAGTSGDGHDGHRQVLVPGRAAVEGRVGPRHRGVRRRTAAARCSPSSIVWSMGIAALRGAGDGGAAHPHAATASRSRRSRSASAWSCRPTRR